MKKVREKSEKYLQLSYTYFGAGPGLGGVSELTIYWEQKNTLISFNPDRSGPDDQDKMEFLLKRNASWREITALINKQNLYAFLSDGDTSGEYAWPSRMQVGGNANFITTLIKWTWAGPPLADIVAALVCASDEQLEHLFFIEKSNKIEDDFARKAIKYFSLLENPEADVDNLITRRRGKLFTIKDIIRDRLLQIRVESRAEKALEAKEKWALEPFLSDIENIIKNWAEMNPSRSTAESMGKSAKRAAISKYLKEYILKHNKLPSGKHTATIRAYNTKITVKFNADALLSN